MQTFSNTIYSTTSPTRRRSRQQALPLAKATFYLALLGLVLLYAHVLWG